MSTAESAAQARVRDKVGQILTSDESITVVSTQKKPLLNWAPDSAVLTNRRFIIYRPRMFGRVTFEDYIWRDLQDAKLTEGMLGATLSMRTVAGRAISLAYLPKDEARRLYAVAQEMEEKVREERRAREMEETRAAAGGVVVQGAPTPTVTGAPTAPMSEDPVAKLSQLKGMLDAGLISSEEFDSKKAEILSRM